MGATAAPVEVGGAIRRVAILTVRLNPCACYLARRLHPSGAKISLFTQAEYKVEPFSRRYFQRLLEKRGVWTALDNLLLHALRTALRLPGRLLRGPTPDAGSAGPPALREDPDIAREPWLTVVEVADINGVDQERLRSFEPDLVLLAGAPILSRRTIGIARVACINPHCGITPDYAGGSPAEWAIFERRFSDVGYTIHLVEPVVDSGPVLHQERVAWDPSRSNRALWPLLAQHMYDRLAEIALGLIAGRRYPALPQGPPRVMPPPGLVVRSMAEVRRRLHARSLRRGRSVEAPVGRR